MSRARIRLQELSEAPLGRLLFAYAWPALVSMTLNALYAVVDRAYIGHGCGRDAMAGLTLAFPLLMFFGACGVLVGVGHSTLLSIKLGAGDRTAAEKILGELVACKLVVFALLPPLTWFLLDPILNFTGGRGVSPAALAEAKDYLTIVLFPQLFAHLAFGLSAALRAEGAAVRSMSCLAVGFGLNLALDPLFIFGFGLGVKGAAWATDIAMAGSCAWALAQYLRGRSAVRLRLRHIRFHGVHLRRALAIGVSPFTLQLLGSAINFSLQAAFAKWAATPAEATARIASLGVFQMVMLLFFMPVMGVQQGLSPILGYNWGARNYARVRSAVVLGFWIVTGVVSFAAAVQVFAPGFLVRIFAEGKDAAFIALAAGDLRTGNCMLWCIGINVIATTYFQAIGRPRTAVLLSVLRQGFCLLPCIWILPHFMSDRLFAVWLALPISDVLCQLATLPPLLAHLRFLRRAGSARATRIRPGDRQTPCQEC